MSGSLRLCSTDQDWKRHDHVALHLDSGLQLRYHDPRRFGLVLHLSQNHLSAHPLLQHLGPEPLGRDFNATSLWQRLQRSERAIKLSIMDAAIVVGVGNIYAAEALFLAGIDPRQPSRSLSLDQCRYLCRSVRAVLRRSIRQGGTTLRDFVNEHGQPGYFRQQLNVYDRAQLPCHRCQTPIQRIILGQRSTFFCPKCQNSSSSPAAASENLPQDEKNPEKPEIYD